MLLNLSIFASALPLQFSTQITLTSHTNHFLLNPGSLARALRLPRALQPAPIALTSLLHSLMHSPIHPLHARALFVWEQCNQIFNFMGGGATASLSFPHFHKHEHVNEHQHAQVNKREHKRVGHVNEHERTPCLIRRGRSYQSAAGAATHPPWATHTNVSMRYQRTRIQYKKRKRSS